MYEPRDFRPTTRRRRLLIVGLAVATALAVMWAMTRKSGVVRNATLHPADVAACTGGQASGCVGSMTQVITPPAATSSAASR